MFERLKSLLFGGPPPDLQQAPEQSETSSTDTGASEKQSRSRRSDSEEDTQKNRLAHQMPGEFERVFGREDVDSHAWIGVDLDGTLSEHSDEVDLETIGQPIPEMVARVEDWLAHGYKVKILTARACVPEGIPPIKAWLKTHQLPNLPITDAKDLHMIELWDDRGVQVIANTGQAVGPSVLDKPTETPEGDSAENEETKA